MTARVRHATEVGGGLALSWLGQYLHNLVELDLSVWRPENSVTALVAVALGLLWWKRPGRLSLALLAGWAGLLVVGGAVLSVLPIGLFPFAPEQSASHYAVHGLYGALQLPLVWAILRAGHVD